MEKSFHIDIVYKGEEQVFEGRLIAAGYTHKFIINVNELEVTYEPDEERNYRAITNGGDLSKLTDTDKEIIGLICKRLEELK